MSAKKSAAPKGRKASKEHTSSSESISLRREDVRALRQIIQALVEENAYSRIRHRALLDVLGNGFDPEEYFARFVELYERDFRPLVFRAFITSDAFAEHFGAWIRKNNAYYRSFWIGNKNDDTSNDE